MPHRFRAGLVARLLLTIGALLPYWPLLTFRVLYVTDDYFASDIFNGELPGRVLVGQMIRHGQWPVWTNQLCSGLSLAGSPVDPLSLALFALLPTAPALDLYVIVLLLIAAHGAYTLARRFGADRPGSVLAGIAFAGSGYIACQLKHLGIIATVVWLPVGLVVLHHVFTAERAPRRALWMGLFGLVFAQQVLSGFVQSAYICALVYGSFAVFCAWRDRQRAGVWRPSIAVLGGLGAAALLGAASGAVYLLPLSAVAGVSDRAAAGWDWVTRLAYWPPNAITFLFPYANGDISNNTYGGPPFFWEDYGYVGLVTMLLAAYGAIRERRCPLVAFTVLMTLVAYLCVLGRATPFYRVVYLLVPGISVFRFPTRFLIVVELGLAVLGAIGLTRARADLARRWSAPSRLPLLVAVSLCALTALDLFVHQPRQNPMVPASEWLAKPASIAAIEADTPRPRTFTPRHRDLHRKAFLDAAGWTNVTPYFQLRDLLEPNIGGGLWNTPSADCYAGIDPRWYVDVWGDHNREASVMAVLTGIDFNAGRLVTRPVLANVLRTYGVTHVLSAYPQQGTGLVFARRAGIAYVYRVDDAQRVRFVRAARVVKTELEAARRLMDVDFDPSREILLHDVAEPVHPTIDETPAAGPEVTPPAITSEDSRHVVVDVTAPAAGFLLLADTLYPGWSAEVDGAPVTLYRANLSVRGVAVPKGQHQVRFTYDMPGFASGAVISAVALSALLATVVIAAHADRRNRWQIRT